MSDASISQMLVNGQNDLMWFNSNLNKLKSKYDNKFVAFHDKTVIDSDPNLKVLLIKLKKKRIDTSNVFIEFISKVKAVL